MNLAKKRENSLWAYSILDKKYPNVSTFLNHETSFQLLIAVILSAQCTDERVNKVTPKLFKKFGTPQLLGEAPLEEIKECIKSVNFFNNKSINIKNTAQIIHHEYKGKIPEERDLLTQLPGVGRKTANVVLGQAFGKPGITVDTHVKRVTTRLGLTNNKDAVKIEFDLMKIWKDDIWSNFSTVLILHGRNTCKAQKPLCIECCIKKNCPSSKNF